MKEIKQVIIIRKDLRNIKGEKIRTGKYIAQASHAVLWSILGKLIKKEFNELEGYKESFEINEKIEKGTAIHFYLTGLYKKTILAVNSEEELINIHNKIKEAGYESTIIKDAGLTEFGGKETYTCLAVEPVEEKEIDKITGSLSIF